MSTGALVEPVVEESKTAVVSPTPAFSLTEEIPAQAVTGSDANGDPHPLVPVFILGALAFMGTVVFVGAILMWLALRNSGVLAP
jgi:hypothetical protein